MALGEWAWSRRVVFLATGIVTATLLGCRGTGASVRSSLRNDGSPTPGAAGGASVGQGGDQSRMAPYLFPGLAAAFRDNIAADSGAPTAESEAPVPNSDEDSGPDRGPSTTNPVLPRPGANRKRRTGPENDETPVSIRFPGPDSAGFPNSAFTMPKGRVYVESDPLAYYTPSRFRNRRYTWEFLLRYGLTDDVEFRVFSSGFTVLQTHPTPQTAPAGRSVPSAAANQSNTTTGFSPLAFDFKIHLWDENPSYFVPATALEVYIQTTFGSPAFNAGTQPSVALNFDQGLPLGWTFEWAMGITGNRTNQGQTFYQYSFQWSLQHNVVGDFDAYVHGFVNNSALPRIGTLSTTPGGPPESVVGVGGIWTVTERFAVFGSYNFGLNAQAHTDIALLGGAYAF